jgi:chemotaxis protein CheC
MRNKLQEINKRAVIRASEALSNLVSVRVKVDITRAEVKNVENLVPSLSREEMVVGVYLLVTGDISGASLLVFPKETAFVLSDLLVKRAPGTTQELTELDKSALKEVGNSISGNYLSVLANVLDVKVIEHAPNFSYDMFGATVSEIIAELARVWLLRSVIEGYELAQSHMQYCRPPQGRMRILKHTSPTTCLVSICPTVLHLR